MSFSKLDKSQTDYLRRLVKGKVVADLGCGMGFTTRLMARWGACKVHGVDKEPLNERNSKKVNWHRTYFAYWEVPKDVDLAVVSWPQNAPLQGLIEIIQSIPHVVYIGKNTDGTACGNPRLMAHLSSREVHTYIPNPQNVFIHYGDKPRDTDTYYHEEYAGMTTSGTWATYDPLCLCFTLQEWGTRLGA